MMKYLLFTVLMAIGLTAFCTPANAAPKKVVHPPVCATSYYAGHAGGNGTAHPDNIAAFDASYAVGVRLEEMDIQFYGDVPYLHHDAITDPTGLDTVQQLADWLVAHPTVKALPEIKAATLTETQWTALRNIFSPVHTRIFLASFFTDETQAAKAHGFSSGLIWSETLAGSESKGATIAEMAADGTTVEADLHDITTANVAAMHAAGVITVYAWVADSSAQYAALPAGVVPMGDYPSAYYSWRTANC